MLARRTSLAVYFIVHSAHVCLAISMPYLTGAGISTVTIACLIAAAMLLSALLTALAHTHIVRRNRRMTVLVTCLVVIGALHGVIAMSGANVVVFMVALLCQFALAHSFTYALLTQLMQSYDDPCKFPHTYRSSVYSYALVTAYVIVAILVGIGAQLHVVYACMAAACMAVTYAAWRMFVPPPPPQNIIQIDQLLSPDDESYFETDLGGSARARIYEAFQRTPLSLALAHAAVHDGWRLWLPLYVVRDGSSLVTAITVTTALPCASFIGESLVEHDLLEHWRKDRIAKSGLFVCCVVMAVLWAARPTSATIIAMLLLIVGISGSVAQALVLRSSCDKLNDPTQHREVDVVYTAVGTIGSAITIVIWGWAFAQDHWSIAHAYLFFVQVAALAVTMLSGRTDGLMGLSDDLLPQQQLQQQPLAAAR